MVTAQQVTADSAAPRLCACGCGEPVKTPGKRFNYGHKARLVKVRIESEDGTAPDFLDWLRDHLDRSGLSPREAAQRAGLNRNMVTRLLNASNAPGPKAIRGLTSALGASVEWETVWLARIASATAVCRACGKKSVRAVQGLASYDPETGTYLCIQDRHATKRPTFRCSRCGVRRMYRPSAVKHLKSAKPSPDGKGPIPYLCAKCNGHDALKAASRVLLAKRGVGPRDDPAARTAVLMDNLKKRRPGTPKGNAGLEAWRLGERRSNTVSEAESIRRSAGKFIAGSKRKGEFGLCLLCRKLIYLQHHRKTRATQGFHAPCYKEWQHSKQYREWSRQFAARRSLKLTKGAAHAPIPVPPAARGRRPSAVELEEHFRWTIRRYLLRQGWDEIAQVEDRPATTIHSGVRSLIGHLPASWWLVFRGTTSGKSLDRILPMERFSTE